jgi:hypothetical protein
MGFPKIFKTGLDVGRQGWLMVSWRRGRAALRTNESRQRKDEHRETPMPCLRQTTRRHDAGMAGAVPTMPGSCRATDQARRPGDLRSRPRLQWQSHTHRRRRPTGRRADHRRPRSLVADPRNRPRQQAVTRRQTVLVQQRPQRPPMAGPFLVAIGVVMHANHDMLLRWFAWATMYAGMRRV